MPSTLSMKKIFITLLLIALIIPIIGCGKKQAAVDVTMEKNINFTTIEQGAYCGLTEEKNYTITTNDEWQTFWQKLKANQLAAPNAPTVDFSQEMVIASAMGEQSTGGYKIEIDKIMETDKISVYLKKTTPNPQSFTSQALTQPYVIVKIPLTNKSFNFITE